MTLQHRVLFQPGQRMRSARSSHSSAGRRSRCQTRLACGSGEGHDVDRHSSDRVWSEPEWWCRQPACYLRRPEESAKNCHMTADALTSRELVESTADPGHVWPPVG